jgi:hypothetical protein
MKQFLLFITSFLWWARNNTLFAQSSDNINTHMFRLYEDNDFLNIRGKGTDNSYTNGTRFDLFYTKKKQSRFFIDRLMPKAGDSSINIFSWSLAQLMVTPNDISTTQYQPNDYPYAGALFAAHSLYSYNAERNIVSRLNWSLVFAVRFLAKQSQTLIHSFIHYQKPMGWDNQLKTYPLFNINFTAETQFLAIGNYLK